MTSTGLWKGREFGAMCVLLEMKGVQNAMWGCVLAHVSTYITPNCISEEQLMRNWKRSTQI
jgi:hypothetical protein